MAYEYIERFKKFGFGLFVHFGLYSVIGKGEWYMAQAKCPDKEYVKLKDKFYVDEKWAEKLVATAKNAGAKYITLTTRHHEGFSLFDTCGLSDYDAPHSACKRDLVREFVDACNAGGIIPFFYHTLLDWHNEYYNTDFPKYIDYLIASVEILCKNYGKIGGLWFDGKWDKPDADWQEDRLYATIRKYQPEAMIINNTGLSALGETGNKEIDSVTFERGKPFRVKSDGKPLAGEVCESLTDHWGYAADDICFKSTKDLISLLIDCRKFNHNLLLNAGPRADGTFTEYESALLGYMGQWQRKNDDFLSRSIPAETEAENADVFYDGEFCYAVTKGVPMLANANVARAEDRKTVTLKTDKTIKDAVWLDSGEKILLSDGKSYIVKPFDYGTSLYARVAKFRLV